jgi:acyl carrier protein
MNVERKEIEELVFKTLECFFVEYDLDIEITDGEQTKLFGGDGVLDSLGLVSFVVAVEEAIEDKYNVSLVLADEKAMSRRTSPFGRVAYLIDYIFETLNENSNE